MEKIYPKDQDGLVNKDRIRSIVLLKNVRIEQDDAGDVTVSMPAKELSSLELRLLSELFPNTGDKIEKLLSVECLFSHLA